MFISSTGCSSEALFSNISILDGILSTGAWEAWYAGSCNALSIAASKLDKACTDILTSAICIAILSKVFSYEVIFFIIESASFLLYFAIIVAYFFIISSKVSIDAWLFLASSEMRVLNVTSLASLAADNVELIFLTWTYEAFNRRSSSRFLLSLFSLFIVLLTASSINDFICSSFRALTSR